MVTYTFTNGTVANADEVNQNFKDTLKIQTQIPYTTLESTGSWVNSGYAAADRFTTASGVNSTVNTGSSSGAFSIDRYEVPLNGATGITYNPDSFATPENAFDNNSATSATNNDDPGVDSVKFGKTFTLQYVASVRARFSYNYTRGSTFGLTISVQYLNSLDVWTTAETLLSVGGNAAYNGTIDKYTQINQEAKGVRIIVTSNVVIFSTSTINISILNVNQYLSSSTLVIDANTLTLSGDENIIYLYSSSLNWVNTSIKAKLSDGTKDISAEATLSQNATTTLPITAAPVADSTLQIIYTLETTDTAVTPELYGYGVTKL